MKTFEIEEFKQKYNLNRDTDRKNDKNSCLCLVSN